MLLRFTVSNFASIRDAQTLDFTLPEIAPENRLSLRNATGHRVTKVLSMVGPNASGKSNILRSISFWARFAGQSFFTQKAETDTGVTECLLSKAPASFIVDFSVGDVEYRHEVTLTTWFVSSERLSVLNKDTKRFNYIFERDVDELKISEKNAAAHAFRHGAYVNPPKNISFLSWMAGFKLKFASDIAAWLSNFSARIELPEAYNRYITMPNFYGDNQSYLNDAAELIKSFDLGLSGIEAVEWEDFPKHNSHRKMWRLNGKHNYGPLEFSLPLSMESEGTNAILELISKCHVPLLQGGVVIIDEFDSSLHPHMQKKLIEIFLDEERNKGRAQLIFTTHSPYILSLLTKYCIQLTEKDVNTGATQTWRLNDVEGVRNDENFVAKYLSGSYGAVPYL